MSDQDGIVAIYNNNLVIIGPALKFSCILCKQETSLIDSYQSLKVSKLKLTSIIMDNYTFMGQMHDSTQSPNTTNATVTRIRRSPLNIDSDDIGDFIFGQDNTEIIVTHVTEL